MVRDVKTCQKWHENAEKGGKKLSHPPQYTSTTVVETATAGDKALRKIQDGIFASTGDIYMNGNSITGLPNPIDRDAAANKNYVDNGGAITKLPNGAFTAVSDIDFDGFSLKKHIRSN